MSLIPPVAKKIPYTHVYHNQFQLHDDYHWLKDQNETKSPAIIDYLNAENAFTRQMHLEKNELLIEKIYQETLTKIKEDDDSVPYYREPYFYYTRTEKGKQYPIRCRRHLTMENPEEVLLDLNLMPEEYISLDEFQVSPNHQFAAYSLDLDGSENYQIFFKDLKTDKILESETIPKTGGMITWFNDNQTILYNTLDKIHRSDKIWKHKIGKKEDELVFEEKDEKFLVWAQKTQSSKYISIVATSSLTREYHLLDASDPQSQPKLFLGRVTGHKYDVEHQGSKFIITTDGAGKYLNNRLCVCPEDQTAEEHWTELIPYDPMTQILDVVPFESHIMLYECTSQAYKQIRILETKDGVLGDTFSIKFSEAIYCIKPSSGVEMDYHRPLVRYKYDSLTTPQQTWEFDLETKEKKLLKSTDLPNGFDRTLYVTERIHAPMQDDNVNGIPKTIPISIVYRKDMFKKDGSNPLMLYGYGSYGISIDPSWSPQRFSLLDRGIVYCIAHIRGGGDCGRGWYEYGKFQHKKNTFLDFISCADELVKQGYTNPKIMAIEGRSAGGLLIAAVLNMRPDLCHAAIAGVPFVDVINTMMDSSIPLTVNEYEEWGNPNELDYFKYILSYSPYENLHTGKLPHILVKAGLNDPRVQYWEPAKWVAKIRDQQLQLKEQDRSTVLFDCKMGSGHFGSSGRYAYYKEIAADYAFVITQLQQAKEDFVDKLNQVKL
ncbi:peptidase S9A prolyl oligopeptidase domain protein beta-propeller [Gorgonomyces haynaldii]|nr:peptidase S9A prolyl oligopeptidase domain protein beta-propeller [Gorgonomyces haynaldii]